MTICKDCAFSEFCAESGKPNAWTSDAANAGEMAEEMEYAAEYLSTPCFWFSFDSAGYGRQLKRVAMRLRQVQRELDEAAKHINAYLGEVPLNPSAHNWLIRNGYRDESYQAEIYGQEVVDDTAIH